MKTGFGSKKPWSPTYSPSTRIIITKSPAQSGREIKLGQSSENKEQETRYKYLGLGRYRTETEDNTKAEIPDTTRTGTAGAQPTPAARVALYTEHARTAVGISDWLHRHPQSLAI